MILGGNQYYVRKAARRCGLSNATNLFRSVPHRLRKYLDSGGWDAQLLQNLFAINVLRSAVDTQTSQFCIIFVKRALRLSAPE